ncbi:MAG: hypothetical protein P8Z78_07640 [Gammaproteobacteria bacterium]|jgi:hypothetical protein
MTATLALHDLVHRLYEQMVERKAFTQLDDMSRAMIDRALEKVIDGTDSRIRLVPNYKRKLFKSIITALDHADRLVEQIPYTIDLDSRHFIDDPYTRALFPTLSGLRRVCHQSSELREFFRESEHWNASQSTALLCMHRNEETVYGMELDGDHVIKDVCQQRVTFDDHHLYSPAEDEQEARLGLKCCIFEGLVNTALANLSQMRKRRLELETRQQVLNARIRSQGRLGSTSPDFQRLVRERGDLGSEERELKSIEKELEEIGYLTPENCLQQVSATLSDPEKFIRVKNLSYRLDNNNIIRNKSDASHKSRKLHFAEVRIMGEQPRVVTLARINRQDVEAVEPQAATIH